MTLVSVAMKSEETPRKTGRPLSFDREDVLQRAMLAFWQSGYETTSVSDLTAAMGVTAPSLYAAFGNKQQLFLEAMRLYAGDPAALERAMNAAPTARAAVSEMLHGAAVLYTGETTPKGCLMASAAATGSQDAAEVRAALTAERAAIGAMIQRRIERDKDRQALSPDTPAAVLADLVLGVMQGMSVLARDGAGRDRLLALATASLACWDPYQVVRTGTAQH